jgi:fatty acid desaturase
LQADGWFDRDWKTDFTKLIGPCLFMVTLGTIISYRYPVIASLLIGVAMQQAGWMGHDYVHARGRFSFYVASILSGIINCFSMRWWSHKHNFHHTFPNRKEYDVDIYNEPVLHLWFPDETKDVWHRRYQYIFYPIAYTFLYVSWRIQSLQFVLGSKNWFERLLIVAGYIWLACLPWKVAVASVLIGGFLVAFVVTTNHQPEEMLEDKTHTYNYVVDQALTTRGVVCYDPITEYLFGGMQYQLEHHMFPHMPKYRYPALRPLLKKFCEENGIPFKVSSIPEILLMNFNVMKRYSAPLPTSPTKKTN